MNIKLLLLLIIIASLSVLIGIIILIVLFTNNTIPNSSTQSKQNVTPNIQNATPSELAPSKPWCGETYCLGSHQIFERTSWGGRAPLTIELIKSPVSVVIIKHTGGGTCRSFKTCSGKVQSLDSSSIVYGLPQIGYNFLIGGDGNIYVGRGWDVQADQIPNTIDIAFIGSYSFDVLTDSMIEATQLLLKDGIERNKLTEDYKLIAHNQTTNTESPGGNVYKEIIKWPHYNKDLRKL